MDFDEELAARMRRPQRHRLLQGFPAVAAMERAVPVQFAGMEPLPRLRSRAVLRGVDGSLGPRGAPPTEAASLELDRSRALLVGIIPHTQCIPRREGCGFCTFPHDRAHPESRRRMIETVADDLDHVLADPRFARRKVEAVYLGGGTANLATPDELRALVDRLPVCQRS
jgi:oxygen-independent coproporphyrinogen-3 oxidase